MAKSKKVIGSKKIEKLIENGRRELIFFVICRIYYY